MICGNCVVEGAGQICARPVFRWSNKCMHRWHHKTFVTRQSFQFASPRQNRLFICHNLTVRFLQSDGSVSQRSRRRH